MWILERHVIWSYYFVNQALSSISSWCAKTLYDYSWVAVIEWHQRRWGLRISYISFRWHSKKHTIDRNIGMWAQRYTQIIGWITLGIVRAKKKKKKNVKMRTYIKNFKFSIISSSLFFDTKECTLSNPPYQVFLETEAENSRSKEWYLID